MDCIQSADLLLLTVCTSYAMSLGVTQTQTANGGHINRMVLGYPLSRFAPVDCVHIICYDFRCDPDSKWWSHKSNGPGVSFEVALEIILAPSLTLG